MTIGIIPARYASTRFPGKLLADLNGRPVLQWTWEAARAAEELDRLVIAAGDEKIAAAARSWGADVVEVFEDLPSGSDRVWLAFLARSAEWGVRSNDSAIVVNIQGDEPMLDPGVVDAVVARLKSDPRVGVATAATRIRSAEEGRSSSVVKVVLDGGGYAVRFTRAPLSQQEGMQPLRHIGLYAFRAEVLKRFTELPPSESEQREHLEQLRLLDDGVKVAVAMVDYAGVAVDREGDLERVRGDDAMTDFIQKYSVHFFGWILGFITSLPAWLKGKLFEYIIGHMEGKHMQDPSNRVCAQNG